MRIHTTSDVDVFKAEAGPWLRRDPVENNVLLYHAYDPSGALPGDGDPRMVWVTDDADAVTGAAWLIPPYRMTVSDMPVDAATALAEELAKEESWLPGVNGPTDAAAAFAARWSELTGQQSTREREQWLMVCDKAAPVPGVAGEPRLGTPDEIGTVAEWFSATMRDSGMAQADILRYTRHMVSDQVEHQRLIVWTDGGEAVGAAGWARPIDGVVRPSGVFVRPDQRQGGYAAALLGEVTARALAAGATACTCIHFVQYAAMQAVVEKVGYRHVRDLTEFRFG